MSTSPLMPPPRMLRPEPWLNAMAAVAIGMFIGCWVIGPVLFAKIDAASRGGTNNSQALTYEQMLARPDPSPYRTPTPQLDTGGDPHYAEAARTKARAGNPWTELQQQAAEPPRRSHWHYQVPDRHAIY